MSRVTHSIPSLQLSGRVASHPHAPAASRPWTTSNSWLSPTSWVDHSRCL